MTASLRRDSAEATIIPLPSIGAVSGLVKSDDHDRLQIGRWPALGLIAGLALSVSPITAPTNAAAADSVSAMNRTLTRARTNWEREAHRECPGHHVGWISDVSNADLVDGFDARQSAMTRRKIEKLMKPYDRHCADDTEGYDCAMAEYVLAVERLGLLKQFTTYSCKAYRCEEPTICTTNDALLHKPQ